MIKRHIAAESFHTTRNTCGAILRQPLAQTTQVVAAAIAWAIAAIPASAGVVPDFVAFESDQVRPIALSPNGTKLFVANTPDGHVEIFDVTTEGITRIDSVPVGMEPVAVAARSEGEVWVVNHLSDSISIIDAATGTARVTRTLPTCDEPRDIVIGGENRSRVFVTAARRGQHCPVPALSSTPGIGRALVLVYDATALNDSEGAPSSVLELFSDKPRALAVTPDGGIVYAAAFHSGNQTTSVHELGVCDGGSEAPPCEYNGAEFPGGLPEPTTNFEGIAQPERGLIVRYDPVAGMWTDELDRNWNDYVRFDLPDHDVFAIDAIAASPTVLSSFRGVGTVLFNLAVNPANGRVYATNTEARNEVRFSSPGAFGHSTLRGHQHEARITVLDEGGVLPRHLNKHIDYEHVPVPSGVREHSLAGPTEMAVSSDGDVLYVVAMSSNAIGIFQTAELEDDSFVPDASTHIAVPGGPTGLVLDEQHDRLYVLTRYDNSVAVVDLAARREIARHRLHNPESHWTTEGRPFLYDATLSSSNGEASCASCHVFGDLDGLAWDLGDPLGRVVPNPNPPRPGGTPPGFHPLKGPMVTMSLRGMANHGPLHWRGDRTGLMDSPPTSAMNVQSSFRTFNEAFEGLLGRDEGPIDDHHMSQFAAFAERITYPPNPMRSLDNILRPREQNGRHLYFAPTLFPGQQSCQDCHRVDPPAGLYGTNRLTSGFLSDWFKIPHFRNLYQRVGMFGMAVVGVPDVPLFRIGGNDHMGDQVRGFGFQHDGAADSLGRFINNILLSFPGATEAERQQQRDDLEEYLLAIESNLAPIVGHQVTLDALNGMVAGEDIDLMIARSSATYPNVQDNLARECDLVVKGTVAGERRGWLRRGAKFYSDRAGESSDDAELRALASLPRQELTYTCVPPGSGVRVGLDRDGDGIFDGDEIDRGLNPDVPARIPGGGPQSTDCVATFTVLNPSNAPLLDRRDRPNRAQECIDGDPFCDSDGTANGRCEFILKACFNSPMDECSSAGLKTWHLRTPAIGEEGSVDSANAAALRAAVQALDFAAASGESGADVTFPTAFNAKDGCTDAVTFAVPLRGGNADRRAIAKLRTIAVDDSNAKDTDRLKLTCLPRR